MGFGIFRVVKRCIAARVIIMPGDRRVLLT